MNLFSMAFFISALKHRAKNSSISDEEFVRILFTPFILAGKVQNKNDDPLDLNKSRVSKILSQEDDVPTAMRNALTFPDIFETTRYDFIDVVYDHLSEEQLPELVVELFQEIENTPTISSAVKEKLSLLKNDAPEFLCVAFFEAVRQNNLVQEKPNNYLWHCGSNSLQFITGDLFRFGFNNRKKQPNIVVIPVNTSFDTHISWMAEGTENPIVAPTTIHGRWIDRWIKAGNAIEALNTQIETNLLKQNLPYTVDSSGRKHFNIGSIVVVNSEKAIYYLLAISRFDQQNIAHSTEPEIRTAVRSLMRFYNHYGMGYPMYLPLLGTGRSRTALDYRASFELIRNEIMRDTQLIQGNITIVTSKEAKPAIQTEVE